MEKVISKINNINIAIIDNGIEKLVPIKPICQALGVNYTTQLEKIKDDEILGATVPLWGTVGRDGKQREMICLPLEFVFGWLFTINPGNVNENARESVRKYRLECYRALFNHFNLRVRALEKQNNDILVMSETIAMAQYEFATARNRLKNLSKEFAEIRNRSIDDIILDLQSEIIFDEE